MSAAAGSAASSRLGGRQGVDFALHVLDGLFDLRHGQGIYRRHAEMSVYLCAGGGVVDRGHAHPCIDDGRQRLAFRVTALRDGGGGGGGHFGEGGPFFRRKPVKHIQHPAAKRLGYRSAREHGQEVAAAKGEEKTFYRERRFGVVEDFNDLRHVKRKFVRMGAINFRGLVFPLESKCFGKLNSTNPKVVLVGDGGKSNVVESEGL